jgi:hypothetical protein
MRTPFLRECAGIGFAFALLAVPLRAEGARIVDAPGLPPFTNLQEAVDAATDGDTILVAQGSYDGFTIDNKTLSIVAVPSHDVEIEGTVQILDLALERKVLLSNLKMVGQSQIAVSDPGLIVENSLGDVRIEGCTIEGGAGWYPHVLGPFGDGGHASIVEESSSVVFSHSTITGGAGAGDLSCMYGCGGGTGGVGLFLESCSAALYQCSIRGGLGGPADQAGYGGHGGSLHEAWLFAAGTSFTGGNGGEGDCLFGAGPPGNGGTGLYVGAGASADLLASGTFGGAGGIGYGCTQNGQSGPGLGGPGQVTQHPGALRLLGTQGLEFDRSTLEIQVKGEPGDQVWLNVGLEPGFHFLPSIPGAQLVRGGRVSSTPQVIPSSGLLAISIQLPDLITEADRALYMQSLGIDVLGAAWLGSPQHVLILDGKAPPDCNGNQQSDLFDVLMGSSIDCGFNLVPDECAPDCDGNGIPDDCDVTHGTHLDCNENGVPDLCDLARATSRDCNHNGVPDECDLMAANRPDQNGNGILDECEPNSTWWVDDSALVGGNGSEGSPFQTIAQAFSAAISGDQILLRDGVYVGSGNRNLSFGGRTLVVRSERGPESCVLDLQALGRGFLVDKNVRSSARIEGLTFRNGLAGGDYQDGGGAIRVFGSHLTIRNCVFDGCKSGSQGGAIRLDNSGAQIEDCVFLANRTVLQMPGTNLGGAIFCATWNWPTNPEEVRIVRCRFEGNASGDGGAIHSSQAQALSISHCTFLRNWAQDSGGAIANGGWNLLLGGDLQVDDCLFAGNRAEDRGGALWSSGTMWLGSTAMRVSGSTFTGNGASLQGGAVAIESESSARLANCVAWNNTASMGSQLGLSSTGSGTPALSVERCDIQGGQGGVSLLGGSLTWATGNLDVDPQFADPDGPDNNPLTLFDNDYRPSAGSPVNDAGDNALVPPDVHDIDGDGNTSEPTPLDLDFKRRFVEDLLAPNVGGGTPPIVDMGGYEHP